MAELFAALTSKKLLDDMPSALFDKPKGQHQWPGVSIGGGQWQPHARRELLGAGASAALGLSPLGKTNSAFAQNSSTSATPTSQTWDDGELEHLLPTSSHDRILIKASFKKPLGAAPSLQVGDQSISGLRSDTRGYFWQFHAGDLKPGTSYELSLRSSDGRSLSQSWKLSTMPGTTCRASSAF